MLVKAVPCVFDICSVSVVALKILLNNVMKYSHDKIKNFKTAKLVTTPSIR